MSPAQGRRWKRGLLKDVEREALRRARERERNLRREIALLRKERDEGLREVRSSCAARRTELRERCRSEQEDMRGEVRRLVEAAQLEISRERREREGLRKLEKGAKASARAGRPTVTRAERRSEDDEAVLANLDPELHALFHRVKRSIKGSDRMSRTEAFLQYVHDNPGEALAAIEDKTDALIEEMEREAEQHGGRRRASGARRDPRPRRDPSEQIKAYVDALRRAQPSYEFGLDEGRSYLRLWKRLRGSESRSAVAFIAPDGTLYRSDSWRQRGRLLGHVGDAGRVVATRAIQQGIPALRLVGKAPEAPEAPAETRAQLLQRRGREIEEQTVRHVGARYARERDVKDVAKLVRQDIAQEIKRGRLPRAKYSVRIDRYSMGREVRITISDVVIPGAIGLKLWNEARLLQEIADPSARHRPTLPRLSEPAQRLLDHVEGLLKAYQKSERHGESGYYDNNFHAAVDFDTAWSERVLSQQTARLRARTTPSRDRRARRPRRDSPKESPTRGRLHRYVIGFPSSDGAGDFRRRAGGRPADERTVVVDAYSSELDRGTLARLAR